MYLMKCMMWLLFLKWCIMGRMVCLFMFFLMIILILIGLRLMVVVVLMFLSMLDMGKFMLFIFLKVLLLRVLSDIVMCCRLVFLSVWVFLVSSEVLVVKVSLIGNFVSFLIRCLRFFFSSGLLLVRWIFCMFWVMKIFVMCLIFLKESSELCGMNLKL